MSSTDPRVTVFGPSPILSVTIERLGDGDDIHIHPGGQGVWVSRMVGELGATPIMCAFTGGETGAVLGPMLEQLPGELRATTTACPSSAWIIDRRSGERKMLAHRMNEVPSRHELDHLFSEACAAALDSAVLVVCGAVPEAAVPLEIYTNLVKDVRAGGTTVVVDLGSPKLDSALEGGPDIVHVNDWQLAEFVSGPVSKPEDLHAAARALLGRGAKTVIVTAGGDPALVFEDDALWELTPPRFEGGAAEGGGDSMVGAIAAALARGLDRHDALRLGAAAGAANFLRHGLGTATRDVIEELVPRVSLKRL